MAQRVIFTTSLTTSQEKYNGAVDLPEDHPIIVAHVLSWVYSKSYPNSMEWNSSELSNPKKLGLLSNIEARKPTANISVPQEPTSVMQINYKVYMLADKLGIDELKKFAKKRFMDEAETGIKSKDFEELLQDIFENTGGESYGPAGLRFAVTHLCVKHHSTVSKRPGLLRVVMEHEEMAFNIGVLCSDKRYERLAKSPRPGQRLAVVQTGLADLD